jgi:hypothetical protein
MSVARVTIYGTCGPSQTINRLHFKRSDVTTAQLIQLGTLIVEQWIDFVRGAQFNAMLYQLVRVQEIEGSMRGPFDTPVSMRGTQASTANFTPVMAEVLKFRTPSAGRHGRGRTYLAGCGGSDMDNGNWSNQQMNRLIGLCIDLSAKWLSPSGTTLWSLVLVPRTGLAVDAVTVEQIIPRQMIGFQRRRNLGVGW